MQTKFRWFTGIFCALAAAALASAFEGRVSLSIKAGREGQQVVDYVMKGSQVRMEIEAGEAGQVATIMNWEKQEMLVIMPAQQMYMVMPMKPRAASAPAAKGPEAKLEKTGRTDTILGYACEEWVSTERGQSTALWLTDQLGNFGGLGGGNPMAGMMGGGRPSAQPGWEAALKGKMGAFPLRVVTRDEKGKELFRLEALKVEPGTPADALFQPPAGYQKFAMPQMGGLPGFGG